MDKNKNNISFEGIGKVTIEYQKYTKEIAKDFIADTFARTGFRFNIEEIKTFFRTNKIMNEAEDMLLLRPKKVVIEEGTSIIPDEFTAETIIQKGGKIEGKLTADFAEISGGTNYGIKAKNGVDITLSPTIMGDIVGEQVNVSNAILLGHVDVPNADIITNKLNLKKSKLSIPVKCGGSVDVDKSTIWSDMRIGRDLHVTNTKLESQYIDVGGKTTLRGDTTLNGKLETGHLELRDKVELAEGSSTKVEWDTVTIGDLGEHPKNFETLVQNPGFCSFPQINGSLDTQYFVASAPFRLGENGNIFNRSEFTINHPGRVSEIDGTLTTGLIQVRDGAKLDIKESAKVKTNQLWVYKDSYTTQAGKLDIVSSGSSDGRGNRLFFKELDVEGHFSTYPGSTTIVTGNAHFKDAQSVKLLGELSGNVKSGAKKIEIADTTRFDRKTQKSLPYFHKGRNPRYYSAGIKI